MASITVDPSVVDHALPSTFLGLGASAYFNQDYVNAAYQASILDLNPEIIRFNYWGTPGLASAESTSMANFRLLVQHVGCAALIGTTSASPADAPNGARAPNDTTNVRANGDGSSPSDMADWFQLWHNDGLNIRGMEPYNEPDNSVHNGDGSHAPWYGDGTTITQANINKGVTWAAVHVRNYANAIRSKASAMGVTAPRINACSAFGSPYSQAWWQDFMSGVCLDGSTWPYADGNWSYFDTLSLHPYVFSNTAQGQLNGIFWDPGDVTPGPNASIGPKWAARMAHTYQVNQGHPEKMVALNELGYDNTGINGAMFDAATAIFAMGWQKLYNIDYFTSWSINAPHGATGIYPIVDDTMALNTRGCVLRDVVYPMSRNNKQVVAYGQAGANSPASGETYATNNGVPRLPWVASLNANGTVLSILVANIDLTNDEAFTVNLSNVNVTGNITGSYADQTTTVTGSTRCPTITPIPAATSFTKTITHGSVFRFDIPISAVSGSGGGGGGSSSSGQTFPAASSATIDTFDRANGSIGTNWMPVAGGASNPLISGNLCVPVVGGTGIRTVWLPNYYSSDQECYITVKTQNQYCDLILRYNPDDDTGYLAEYESDTQNIEVYRGLGPNQFLYLGRSGNTGRALVDGDILGFRAVGNTLTTWLNGTLVGSVQDNTPLLGAGRVGFGVYRFVDTFGGGGLQTPATTQRHRGKRSGSNGGVR